MMHKHNEGFTLIELVVSMAIALLITGAALSVLLFGMRINAQTTANVKQQNETNMLVQILQNIAEEKNMVVSDDGTSVSSNDGTVSVSYANNTIKLNNSEFMTDVTGFEATMSPDNRLLTINLNNGEYIATVYCRLNTPTDPNAGGATNES